MISNIAGIIPCQTQDFRTAETAIFPIKNCIISKWVISGIDLPKNILVDENNVDSGNQDR
jgi:hypothetical protein